MKLSKDLRAFIESLNSNAVEYLVVGGYAVAYHGIPRFTGDIDFLIRPTKENIDRLVHALAQFGFGGLGIRAEDFLVDGRIIQLGRPPHRIDLLTSISGVDVERAWSGAVDGRLDGLPVRVIGRRELIENKRATGRAKDLADLEGLGED
ncbi:hypothetical protein L6R52_35935 [Myxococcota bacterium]|nr:hypothetical protein [Myxococcota bacterium]